MGTCYRKTFSKQLATKFSTQKNLRYHPTPVRLESLRICMIFSGVVRLVAMIGPAKSPAKDQRAHEPSPGTSHGHKPMLISTLKNSFLFSHNSKMDLADWCHSESDSSSSKDCSLVRQDLMRRSTLSCYWDALREIEYGYKSHQQRP